MSKLLRRVPQHFAETADAFGDVTVRTVLVFWAIADLLDQGVEVTNTVLANHLKIPMQSISRHTSLLGDWAWTKQKGLHLIQQKSNPKDMRQKLIVLSDRGQRLADRLMKTLGG